MAKSISDGDLLYWLSVFICVHAICMAGLVWAVEYMKYHDISSSSLTADLVIMALCCTTCCLIAIMLSPAVWYYASRKTESLHRTEMKDESQTSVS